MFGSVMFRSRHRFRGDLFRVSTNVSFSKFLYFLSLFRQDLTIINFGDMKPLWWKFETPERLFNCFIKRGNNQFVFRIEYQTKSDLPPYISVSQVQYNENAN